ncbi:MAG: hypothetical protein WCT51_00755 [Candidatus Shapirobacteria bacterium]
MSKLSIEESSTLIIDFFSKEGIKLLANNGVKKPILEVDSIYCLEFNREHIGCFLFRFPNIPIIITCCYKNKEESINNNRIVKKLVGNFTRKSNQLMIIEEGNIFCDDCNIIEFACQA